jgi:hypothetical protein
VKTAPIGKSNDKVRLKVWTPNPRSVFWIWLWLREKTARDEMVLNLLGEIGDTLAEIRKKMNEER